MLGGDAFVTLLVQDQGGVFRFIELDKGLQAASRSYGLHKEQLIRSKTALNGFPSGRYQFKLTAALKENTAITETVDGFLTIDQTKPDKRQPGNIILNGVELESGNLALTHNDIPEIHNRGLSLSFTRYYNSQGNNEFDPLGYGWRHNYQVLLTRDKLGDDFGSSQATGPLYRLIGGEGNGQSFSEMDLNARGETQARAPYRGKLRKNADGSFEYFTKTNIKYHFQQAFDLDSDMLFNQGYMGNLDYIEEPNGNRLTLAYDGQGRMAAVTDSSQRKLEFTYEQALTPLVGVIDTGNGLNQTINCRSRSFLRSLRRRFLQADLGVAWRIIKVKGPGGLEINYEYDGNGNLERVTRLGMDRISRQTDDRIWQYAYDPTNGASPNLNHLLKSAKAPNHIILNKNITTYEYEMSQPGRPVKSVNMPEGVTNRYSYTFTNGKVTRATVADGRDNLTDYEFDALAASDPKAPQKRVIVRAPRGARSEIVFNGYGDKLSDTDPEGMTTECTYDRLGNISEQVMRGAGVILNLRANFDQTFSKPLSVTDANGKTTEYTLDGRGNVTSVKLPTGREMTIDYNARGDVTRMVDQYGFVTKFPLYDTYGNTRKIERQTSGAAQVETSYEYDERSRVKSMSGTLEAITTSDYDALDHLIMQTITDPAGFREPLEITMEYLPEGQVKKMAQSGGNQRMQVTSEYDGLNRLAQLNETIKDVGSFLRPFRYDKNSNLLEETDRRGVVTVRTYDELNYLKTVTLKGQFGPDLKTLEQAPDLVGNPKSMTNLYGQTDTMDYDGIHRLVVRHRPGGYTEKFSYDGVGNVLSREDRNGHLTTFTYDAVNRLKEVRDPLLRTQTTTYDDATSTVTRTSSPQGLTEIVRSDGLGRPLMREVKFSDKDYVTAYSYDARKTTVSDPRGIVTEMNLSSFGEAGKMKVIDADPPYSVEMSYSAMGGMKTRTDALGRKTVITLDSLNRPTRVDYPGGFKDEASYDGEGLPLSRTDKRKALSKMTYDNLRRILTLRVDDITQTINVRSVSYDDANSEETVTDANNHSSVLMYDGLHRLTSMKNADGKTMTYGYDGVNLISQSDFKGKTITYEYDNVDRVKTIRDRKGQVTIINHDDTDGYTRTTTDRRTNNQVEAYDQLARLIKMTDGDEPLMSYEYDGDNNRTAILDGLGNRTSYTYDRLNRVRTIDHAGLQTERFSYDAVGNLRSRNDGRGPDILMEYDDIDHLKKQVNGAGDTTLLTYDGEGLLLERIDPKGPQHKTTYTYNALGSLKTVTDARSQTWRYEYDGAQNLKSVTDPLGRTVSYDYDALNRLKQIAKPQNLKTIYGYDENSNRNSITDPNGQISSIGYDELDRLTSVEYANVSGAGPRSRLYGYDPEGNLTSVVEKTLLSGSTPVTRNYMRSFDKRDRAETMTDPFGHTITMGHDAANNITSIKDAEGKQTGYAYDAHNRLKTVTLPNNGGAAQYAWLPDGLLQKVDYGNGLLREYAYDDADRVSIITNTVGGNQKQEHAYTYDPNSNRKTETRKLAGSTLRAINFDYDELDRLSHVAYTSPNAKGLIAEYFDGQDLTNLKARGIDAQIDKTWPGATPPAEEVGGESFSVRWRGKIKPRFSEDYTFTVESDGGVRLYVNGKLVIDKWDKHPGQAIGEDTGTIQLTASTQYSIKLEYRDDGGDAVARLKWESAQQAKETVPQDRLELLTPDFNYTYDAVGNRKTETGTDIYGDQLNRVYDYDDLNRLKSINEGMVATAYAYDNNGNLKQAQRNGQITARYEYDVSDQLRAVFSASNQPLAQYDYDFERHRLQRTANGANTLHYVYAANEVVNEYKVATGNVDRLVNRYDLGADEIIRGEFANEGTRFYFSDALGSTTALTRFSEGVPALAANYEYDAWGSYLSLKGGSSNAIGFTGQRRDNETGLMPLGNGERYYDIDSGRFIQQDSWIGKSMMAQSLNRYAYAYNNPLRYRDRNGHEGESANREPNVFWSVGKGFVTGIVNLALEPFRQAADVVTAGVAREGWGISAENVQLSSMLGRSEQQAILAGMHPDEVADQALKGQGRALFSMGLEPLLKGVSQNISDYRAGRITLPEYNERMGENLGEAFFMIFLEKVAGESIRAVQRMAGEAWAKSVFEGGTPDWAASAGEFSLEMSANGGKLRSRLVKADGTVAKSVYEKAPSVKDPQAWIDYLQKTSPKDWTNDQMQWLVDEIHKEAYGTDPKNPNMMSENGKLSPISLTVTREGRVILSEVGGKPRPDVVKAANKYLAKYEEAKGAGMDAPRDTGHHAEPRGIEWLRNTPDPYGNSAAYRGARQATSHYACEGCRLEQRFAGVENVTGFQLHAGKVTREYGKVWRNNQEVPIKPF
jgi:RHS repeat-associated protein